MVCSKNEIGKKITELRRGCKLSQEMLARELHVSREVVAKWENGTRDLKTEHTVALASYFGVTTDYLLGLDKNKVRDTAGIGKVTGLTDEAIQSLHDIKDGKSGQRDIEVINALLVSRQFKEALTEMERFFRLTDECTSTITRYIEYLQERIDAQKQPNYAPPSEFPHDFGAMKLSFDAGNLMQTKELIALSYFRAGECIKRFMELSIKEQLTTEKENLRKADKVWMQYIATDEGKGNDNFPPIGWLKKGDPYINIYCD